MRRTLRSLAAKAALFALLIGVPALLASTVANPIDGWGDLIAGDLSDTVLIDVLAAVAYLAWAQFAVAVVVEILAVLTRIRVPRRLPGLLPGQQQLAHTLVAAVFLLGPATLPLAAVSSPTTGPHLTPAVATAPSAVSRPAAQATALGTPAAESRSTPETDAETTYVVQSDGPGTYWDLAQHFLGKGERWQEVWDLNKGRQQADGSVMTSPGLLRPGWTVLLPTGRTTTMEPIVDQLPRHVTVQAGDTLSGIAAANEVADWRQLWNANAGRPQPGGATLTDPDHIQPGWTIDVPPAERAAPHSAIPASEPTPLVRATIAESVPATATSAESELPPAPTLAVAVPTVSVTAMPPVVSSAAAHAELAPTVTVKPSDALDATHEADPQEDLEADHRAVLIQAAFGVGGELLAGTAALALLSRRRTQSRHRRPGRAIRPTPPEAAPTARALRVASTDDVAWLDEALRGLTHQLADAPDGRLPDVIAACLTSECLELVLVDPLHDAPGSWGVADDGRRWRLDRDAPTDYQPNLRDQLDAPYPLLASVGTIPGMQHWLIDLERAGVVTLTGDPARCMDLARYIAADLAVTHRRNTMWVTAAGFPTDGDDGIAELAFGRLVVSAQADNAVAAATKRLDFAVQTMQSADIDILAGRLHSIAGDVWYPEALLIPRPLPTLEATELISTLSAISRRTSLAVVQVTTTNCPGGRGDDDPVAGLNLTIDADGMLHISGLGLRMLPHQLTAEATQRLARLFVPDAVFDDVPLAEASNDAAWAEYADISGGVRSELREPVAPYDFTLAQTTHIDVTGDAPELLLAEPLETYLATTATTATDVVALFPALSPEVRERILDADPTLDDDLASWHDKNATVAKLAVLGPVTVHAVGPLPKGSPRRPWNTEIVAYLAAHPRGVTAQQFAADLWPGDPAAATSNKPRQAITVVRHWLGSNPATGQPYLPSAQNPHGGPGLYRMEGLLMDADLFRRLRLRGQAQGAAGIVDFKAALDLVRGVPFDQRRPAGYAWLTETPLDHEYTAMIVDVAHTVATHHLASREPGEASVAAKVALRAGSHDDTPFLDLLAVADVQGHTAEAEKWQRQIMTNHDAEVEEDLPPRTYDILLRRGRAGRPGPVSSSASR